jgi:PknH-like extracellular domain
MIFTAKGLRAGALVGVLASIIVLSGCASTVSGTAVRAQDAAPVDVAPLDESDLDDVLLSVAEINAIVGSTQMRITAELRDMSDHSAAVSDSDCLGTIYGAEGPVYEGTGWTAIRDQVAREPDENNDHWVQQTAVLYPSAENAQKFFDDSRSVWEHCAGGIISVDDVGASHLWHIDDVTAKDTLITQLTTQKDADGWACQHALSVVSNLTVEAWACGYSIADEAATIATDMVANAARK